MTATAANGDSMTIESTRSTEGSSGQPGVSVLDPGATLATGYAAEVVKLLYGLLVDVISKRAPDVPQYLNDDIELPADDRETVLKCLQVQGIWFQLLNIAEENAAMRLRREHETRSGNESRRATFANIVSRASQAGIRAEELQTFFNKAQIRPTITAHPTENPAHHGAGNSPADLSATG